MKLKRTIGTGKIFLYSCGAVIALAGIIWLIINGVYAVYISGEKTGSLWVHSYTQRSADIVTPWLLMAAAAAIYYRYWKMCSANNISCTKQTWVFSVLAMVVPAAFAAVDLFSAKLVFERIYGGIVCTCFEDKSNYFFELISNYIYSLDEGATEISTPYTIKIMLLLFVLMAVYYYCFFITGCYIIQCFRYGRKKTLIYYAVTISLLIFFVHYAEAFEDQIFLLFIYVDVILIGALTNPIIFLNLFPYTTEGSIDSILFGFVFMTAFILITILSIEFIGLKQFPSKRQVEKIIKDYNAKIIAEREEQVNDGQT